MIREVYMGDETRELLRETADFGQSNRAVHKGAPGALEGPSGRTSLPPAVVNRASLSPLARSLERERGRRASADAGAPLRNGHHGADAAAAPAAVHATAPRRTPLHARTPARTPARESEPEHEHEHEHEHGHEHERSSQSRRAGDAAAARRRTSASVSPGPAAKRRRLDFGPGKIPELELEFDAGYESYLHETPYGSPADIRNTPPSAQREAGLPVSAQIGDDTTAEGLRAHVVALKNMLAAKQEHIRALQAELNEREEQHQVEMHKIKQDLHREYSKQASEKLRVIIKRLELSAKKRAEQDWQDRVSKLNEVVENERNEKAELVQACDEYLRLKGF